jgi:hypothetical protein
MAEGDVTQGLSPNRHFWAIAVLVGVRAPTDILKTLLDALGPFGIAAIAVALLVIAVEAVRLR